MYDQARGGPVTRWFGGLVDDLGDPLVGQIEAGVRQGQRFVEGRHERPARRVAGRPQHWKQASGGGQNGRRLRRRHGHHDTVESAVAGGLYRPAIGGDGPPVRPGDQRAHRAATNHRQVADRPARQRAHAGLADQAAADPGRRDIGPPGIGEQVGQGRPGGVHMRRAVVKAQTFGPACRHASAEAAAFVEQHRPPAGGGESSRGGDASDAGADDSDTFVHGGDPFALAA